MSQLIGFILCLTLVFPSAISAMGGSPNPTSGPQTQTDRPQNKGPEVFRIQIHNIASGNISISTDNGDSWRTVGKVILPVNKQLRQIYDNEFTASDWAPVGAIAATAVNAIHIKAGQSQKHARLFSILPAELSSQIPTRSYWDKSSTIFTDMLAGTKIFGSYSPQVGDGLYIEKTNASIQPWPTNRMPELDDKIIIISRLPSHIPEYIEIENKFEGKILSVHNGQSTNIGRVLRPLGGTGRFGGTRYQTPGRIRANHPGVICVSTSPFGKTGGFQIVPSYHANSRSLDYVYVSSAYMVVGPANSNEVGLEGTAPLFQNLLKPGYRVIAKINDNWTDLPEVSGKAGSALTHVEALRIYPEF